MIMPWDRPAQPAPSQPQPLSLIDGLTHTQEISWARTPDTAEFDPCLLYTSDAADDIALV